MPEPVKKLPLLCRWGFHKVVRLEVLRNGCGPDYAAYEVECTRCRGTGYEYCDGDVRLRHE